MKNTKELRTFLVDQMGRVADGSLAADQVKGICNLSQQIYNTMNIEIKTAMATSKLPEGTKISPVSFDE